MLNCNYPITTSQYFPVLQNHHRRFSRSFSPRKPAFAVPATGLSSGISSAWFVASQLLNPMFLTSVIGENLVGGEDGPVEIPLGIPAIFSTDDNPSTLQVASSILLTGAISVFLFRSIRRRAKRAASTKYRSSGEKLTLKEEALESLKVLGSSAIESKKPTSPVQALLGGISAGIIALILFKFTTTVEASLDRQTLSDNFSVRQITVTVRTIVNGLCYLVTFIFGINSLGLLLYSGQLAFGSTSDDSTGNDVKENQPSSVLSSADTELPSDNESSSDSDEEQETTPK